MIFLYASLLIGFAQLNIGFESGSAVTILSLTLIILGHKVWNLYLKFGGR